jgi:nitronate monooxygenase
MYETREDFRKAVREVKSLTEKPFGVNLSLFPALRPIDNDLYVDVLLDEGVGIVETSGHRPPDELLARLKAGGVKTMHKCVSVRHALSAQKAGVDAVTMFGAEGGGHIGELGLATMTLVPRAVEALQIPVMAAGGIADARSFLAALALGAEGVTVGTRLLATVECPIHENVKKALVAATEVDTVPILASLQNTVRVWKNAAAHKVLELESGSADVSEILAVVAGAATKQMYEDGDVDAGVLPCSQDVGVVHEILPVADVIEGMVLGAGELLARLSK